MIDIPEKVMEKYPEIEYNEETENNFFEDLTEEGKIKINKITEDSNSKIGLRPITNKMINNERDIILRTGQYDIKKDYNTIMTIATKNGIMRFLKDNLKMNEKERNALKITEIYPSQSETSSIIYIKCESPDDIAIITSYTKNLPRQNYDDNPPTVIKHIPKEFYTRYQALEKTLWQIRNSDLGRVQTNIRLGRKDFLIRYKQKDDQTKWNQVTPMKIPDNIPPPEIPQEFYKKN